MKLSQQSRIIPNCVIDYVLMRHIKPIMMDFTMGNEERLMAVEGSMADYLVADSVRQWLVTYDPNA